MNTIHKIVIGSAQKMEQLKENSVDLVVTSPPYPMIEMWDEILSKQNPDISQAIDMNNGLLAFEIMHSILDKVWSEVNRVLKCGGFACINIGDATRTINSEFALYPNHSRIISAFHHLGMSNLPNILWRKQTNAPNKFMGSGMLPAGAYVTLEHEWILIFRKGGKRQFKDEENKLKRRESSFFWEERNNWFSDLWDLKGTKQKIDNSESRKRSASYPFEIPYRLINMFSLKGDTVLDPFLGLGTTTIAAITAQRNSIGYEIDPSFLDLINENILSTSLSFYNSYIQNRIDQHTKFVLDRNSDSSKNAFKHFNENLNIAVMTSQEKNISFSFVQEIQKDANNTIIASYGNSKPSIPVIKAKKKMPLSEQMSIEL